MATNWQDIELTTNGGYNNTVPTNPSGMDMDLTQTQQNLLKQMMCDATIDQLRCASNCIQSMIDKMRDHVEETVTVDDFQKATKETQELPTLKEDQESEEY